jgi:prolyl-tRNA editing enzyme YbaK/EbsC (Cys-tRNA(Pro) deacylase)
VHRNVEAVVAAGRRLGLDLRIRSFPEGTRTAADAAAAIGVDLGQIVKSLAFLVDGRVTMALLSGSNRLDEAALAAAAGGARCERADARAVREATGFPIGGIPPFGHASDLPVFVDRDLLAHDEVWAAAGTPHDNFAVTPAELVRATGGTVADLAAR